MKRLLSITATFLAVMLMAGGAMAVTYIGPSSEPSLEVILDGITVDGDSSVNVYTDMLNDGDDAYWAITGSGNGTSTMIIEFSAMDNSNTIGIYDTNDPTNMLTLFTGGMEASDHAYLSIDADGTVSVFYIVDNGMLGGGVIGNFSGNNFGFYIANPTGVYYSDSNLNANLEDHMVAYQGTGELVQLPGHLPGYWVEDEYILAFEDWGGQGSDFDYNDLVIMVQSVQPVPEPATLLLVGSGLLAGASLRRRRKA